MNDIEASQALSKVASDHELIEANQAYGALTAEFYIAGFTFERAMARVLGLLKSGGWAKVGDGFDDVNDFVRSLPLDHFKVLAEQRKEFVERVKELQPAVSNRAIAGALGVAHTTISRRSGAYAPPGARKGPGKRQRRWCRCTARRGRRSARCDADRAARHARRAAHGKAREYRPSGGLSAASIRFFTLTRHGKTNSAPTPGKPSFIIR